MGTSLWDKFLSVFTDLKPNDYHKWQEERDIDKVSKKVKIGGEELDEFRGKTVVQPLTAVRKKVDNLQFTVLHMIPRWQESEATEVRKSIGLVQKEIESLRKEVNSAKEEMSKKQKQKLTKEQEQQLKEVNFDIDGIDTTLKNERDALDKRKDLKVGDQSGFTNHGLKQGWVPSPDGDGKGSFQYQSDEEWEHLKERGVKQDLKSEEMDKVSSGPPDTIKPVYFRKGKDVKTDKERLETAKQRLETERKTSVKLREDMTGTFNNRLKTDGPVKQGVENNVKMATILSGLLTDEDIKPKDLLDKFKFPLMDKKTNLQVIDQNTKEPKTYEEGGILNRIIGDTKGQGQFADKDPKAISEGIRGISERLKKGKLEGDDANKIQQFISGFVDGLTEVNETNKTAQDQFDLLWGKMQAAFGLEKEDKAKLMERVDVYKKLAGGLSDTGMSGKAVRKNFTRNGKMTLDKNTIDDPDALIANDISGSMHSQFLAMEIAETLAGNAKDEFDQPIKGFKEAGASVQIKNKDVLDARMLDALAMTAGGKTKDGKGPDFVMHTAYEMINGVQAITGVAHKVTQETATEVMESLAKGESFSKAMEDALPNEIFPWQLEDAKTVNGRAKAALEAAEKKKLTVTEGDPVQDAVQKLVEDILWMATDLDGPSESDITHIKEELDKGATLTAAIQGHFTKATFAWK